MMQKLEELFEQYNFDYIEINPVNLDYLDWEFVPDEMLIDMKYKPGYLGTIKLEDHHIEVFYNDKVTPGDVVFKYKSIRKERNVKLETLKRL